MRTSLVSIATLAVFCTLGCEQPSSPPATSSTTPSASPAIAEAKPQPVDRWHIDTETNPLDGKRKSTISDSEMVVRCGTKTEAYIRPELPQMGHNLDTDVDRTSRVRYRIDNGKLQATRWNVSTDFEALFMPLATVRQVVRGKQLVVEYHPEYTTEKTETFDLSGLAEAVGRAGCKL